MGQLFKLGKHEIDLETIKTSLTGNCTDHLNEIAPQSSLILESVTFDD